MTCLLIAGAAQGATAKDAAKPTVESTMNDFIQQGEFSGAVTLAHEAGKAAQVTAVGVADREHKTPMRPDALFGIMSMTKPVTATALMILVDEGKVSLDDPVEKYISAFHDARNKNGQRVRGLTIRRLLTHTSGLTGDQACIESIACTANLLAARPFSFQPGERWEYGPSLNVIGRIIEIASGKSYEEFLKERIFKPLAMNDTTFHPTKEQQQRIATLYKKSKDGKSLEVGERWHGLGAPDCVPNPSGGLFSTVGDMDRFYQMILNGGELDGVRIVPPTAVQQMTSVQTGDLQAGFVPGSAWGLGWSLVREPQGVTAALSPGSFGHGGAYGTQGWVDPVKRRVFVLMYQREDIGNSDGSDIRKDFQNAAVAGLEAK
jgi:CubicO group peptidase (beta-lactamase class C family)